MEARMRNVDDTNDNGKTNQMADDNEWVVRLKKNEKTRTYYASPYNLDLILKNDPFFKDIYWFNESTRTTEVKSGGKLRPLEDSDIVDAWTYLTDFWFKTLEYAMVKRVIFRDCHRRLYHPIRDYYDALVWDGIERLPTWLHVYLGAESNDYTSVVGVMSMIAMPARIYEPGCQCDYVPVLEGPQGLGKSSAIKILGGKYYSDYMPDITTKDACIHVCRYHVIEISEMHTLSRADAAAQKQFITRRMEQYRPPHATMEVEYPRQCTIWASINLDAYLKDETGGRRFWPVKCYKIDLEALARDRDQLLAEAVRRYKEGWKWHPPKDFEEQYIRPQQEARLEVDEWLSLLIKNIGVFHDLKAVTVVDVYQHGLGMGQGRLPNNSESQKIGKMLRSAGCIPQKTRKGMVYNITILRP